MRTHGSLVPFTLALLLPALQGCPAPDLGTAPFFCQPGKPACPDGYECTRGQTRVCIRLGDPVPGVFPASGVSVCAASGPACGPGFSCIGVPANICLKEGESLPALDGGPKDLGPGREQRVPDGPRPPDGPRGDGVVVPDLPSSDSAQATGRVTVSELMADPAAVWDSYGEWVELFNSGNQPVDINGWTLKDTGLDKHEIKSPGPLMVPAKGFLILGINDNKTLNGGVTVAYVYSNFFLANSDDEIILVDRQGKTMDTVTYSKATGFAITTGASLSLANPDADNTKAANWCTEKNAWAGSQGDKGSPLSRPGCP